MFEGFIQLPETKYLGFGIMMPWENNLEMQFSLWEKSVTSQKIEMLKELCGSNLAIGIFCYRCDPERHTFSYHIACENKKNAFSTEFEELKIECEMEDQDASFREIGHLCERTENWARVTYHRAKLKLQERMDVHETEL